MDDQRPLNSFELRRAARIARLVAASERLEKESQALHAQAHQMSDAIPFGQPILVGHHSEKRDRRYRDRIHNKYGKSFAVQEKSKELARRAEAAAKNNSIFSDDPDAREKLEDKIARLEARQERMKAANKLVRKGDREGLLEMGFSEKTVNDLFTPDFAGRLGFPDYAITNNSANIRRLKQRVEHIDRHAADESSTETINGVRIEDNVEDNRVQMFFKGKPADSVRSELKSRGFRWSPTNGCWQAFRSNNSKWAAQQIAGKLNAE